MAKEKSNEELENFLKEHLTYERNMLCFTYDMLTKTDGFRWCAMFESFGIHARNLYDFLRNEGNTQNTFRAVDYVPGYKGKPHSAVDIKLNTSFFHLSSGRLKNTPVNIEDAATIGEWIDREWGNWASQLRDPYKSLVDASAICSARTQASSAGPSATNAIIATSAPVFDGGKRGT